MWSEEAKLRNRRRKKAKRLWIKQPLFAFQILSADNENYLYSDFLNDINFKSKSISIRFKRPKSPLARYGRYLSLQKLLSKYSFNKEPKVGIEILRLRKNITKPYRLKTIFNRMVYEFFYPATFSIELMQKLVKLADDCKSVEEFREKEKDVIGRFSYGS